LKAVAARSEHLEKENQRLRQELEQLREKHYAPITHSLAPGLSALRTAADGQDIENYRQALGELSTNKAVINTQNNWEKDYTDLAKQYKALQVRYETKRLAAKRIKDDRDGWVKYAERLEVKYQKLEEKRQHDLTEVPQSSAAVKPGVPEQTEEAEERRELNTSFVSNPESNTRSAAQAGDVQATGRTRRAASTPAKTLSEQTWAHKLSIDGKETVGEPTNEVDKEPELPSLPPPPETGRNTTPIKQEPSSDIPVVVVSERNLRKRKAFQSTDVLPSPHRIKSEKWDSSDPVIMGGLTAFSPHESLDLDEEQGQMPTPKKQKIIYNIGQVGMERTETSFTGGSVHNTVGQVKKVGRVLPWEQPSRRPGNHQRGDSKENKLVYAVSNVAEDDDGGDTDVPDPLPLEQTPEALGRRAVKGGRVQDLLNQTGSRPDPVVLRPTRLARDIDSMDTRHVELDLVALRSERRKTDMIVKTPAREPPMPKANRSAPVASAQQGNKLSRTGSLRWRPLAELKMEDFKINPKMNNGFTHAFDEVVRDRAGRSELEGCVDPNCCGKKFMAMARSELNNGGPTMLTRVADIELLERYLGDEDYRLIGMPREKKETLWLEARTRELANKYGKHRHRFARRPSPPGFWNPDFPTTQEVQEGREEGERVERQIIEDRWREALRGGRWLFRDE